MRADIKELAEEVVRLEAISKATGREASLARAKLSKLVGGSHILATTTVEYLNKLKEKI